MAANLRFVARLLAIFKRTNPGPPELMEQALTKRSGELTNRELDVSDPDDLAAWRGEFMSHVLRALSPPEREALIRFYVQEQTPDQIHRELGMDPNRLRELKRHVRGAYREKNLAILYLSRKGGENV
jgi:DNA-directed RNA polymerase specialized sigma24 family protein